MKEIKIYIILLIITLALITGVLTGISGTTNGNIYRLVLGVILTLLSIRSFRIFKT